MFGCHSRTKAYNHDRTYMYTNSTNHPRGEQSPSYAVMGYPNAYPIQALPGMAGGWTRGAHHAQPTSILGPTSFNNPGGLVHNNLPDNIAKDRISQYSILIDSAHRNIDKYPNPFDFRIDIGNPGHQTTTVPVVSGDGMFVLDVHGHPTFTTVEADVGTGTILEKLSSVKFIRIDQAILPRSVVHSQSLRNALDRNHDDHHHDKDKYTILHIPELRDEHRPCRFGTSSQLSSATAILTSDQIGQWRICETTTPPIVFKDIHDLHSLTIKLLDSGGHQLTVPGAKTCNICRYQSPVHTVDPNSGAAQPPTLPPLTASGGTILRIGTDAATTDSLTDVQLTVNNYGRGLIIVTGTANALPVTVHIDAHARVAGCVLGVTLREPVTWSNWDDASASGSIDTRTLSFHGSLNGCVNGVLRIGYGGVDWWCHIDSRTSTTTAYGWSNLIITGIEDRDNGATVHLPGFVTANVSAQSNDHRADTAPFVNHSTASTIASLITTTAGLTLHPSTSAVSAFGTIGQVTTSTGGITVTLDPISQSVNANCQLGTDTLLMTGTMTSLTVSGSVLGTPVSGTHSAQWMPHQHLWLSGDSLTLSTAASSTHGDGDHQPLRIQGWFGGVFISGTVQSDMTVVCAFVLDGVPGTVTGSIHNARLLGCFQMSDGRSGTINASFTDGTVSVSDGTVLTYDGSTIISSSTGTTWTTATVRGDNWVIGTGDLPGMAVWDATGCTCGIHPQDPRIQHSLLMTVGVLEQNITSDFRPFQV